MTRDALKRDAELRDAVRRVVGALRRGEVLLLEESETQYRVTIHRVTTYCVTPYRVTLFR
jgi:hypothetical protein